MTLLMTETTNKFPHINHMSDENLLLNYVLILLSVI